MASLRSAKPRIIALVANIEREIMMGYRISCPNCGQHLEVEDEHVGTRVDCPGCSKEFTVEVPLAEADASRIRQPSDSLEREQKPCPFCGELILAVARKCKHCGEFLDAGVTKHRQQDPSTPEHTAWEGHPSHLFYLDNYIFGGLLCFIGIGVLIVVWAILDRKTRIFTVTSKRVRCKSGIISRNIQEVAMRDIRSLKFKQGIIERLFGLGSIEIGSAGTGGVEVTLKGVVDPSSVMEIINFHRT